MLFGGTERYGNATTKQSKIPQGENNIQAISPPKKKKSSCVAATMFALALIQSLLQSRSVQEHPCFLAWEIHDTGFHVNSTI